MTKELKIYMATKANKTVGVTLDLTGKTAKRFDVTGSTTTTRMSALEALIAQLESIDYDTLTVPVQVFINDHMLKNINSGFYKYWLMTGCTNDGEEVSAEELELWERFNQVYATNNCFIILHSTFKAKLAPGLLAAEGKFSVKLGRKVVITAAAKQNDKYSAFCWDEIEKLVGKISDEFDESGLERA